MFTKRIAISVIRIMLAVLPLVFSVQSSVIALRETAIVSLDNDSSSPVSTVFQLPVDERNVVLSINQPGVVPIIGSTLYELFTPLSNWAAISQNFDSAHNSLDGEAADDFIVPETDGVWEIESIDILGACNSTNGSGVFDCGILNSANVRIYSDNSGFPGNLVYVSESQPVVSSTLLFWPVREYSINLSSSAILRAGTYWLSVQVNMDYSFGEWGWLERSVQNGMWHVYRNPGGGWEQGCITWCVHWYDPDLAFTLKGNIGGNNKITIPLGAKVSDMVEHTFQSLMYVSLYDENSVAVINTDTYEVVDTISVDFGPQSMIISPDSTRIYVGTKSDYGEINVIDTYTNMVVDTFITGMYPRSLAFGGPGRLYIADGQIGSFNPFTGTLIEFLPQSGFLTYNAHKLNISPDGRILCSASKTWVDIINCHDVGNDAPPPPKKTNICEYITDIDISSDGTRLYVACPSPSIGVPGYISVLDLVTLAKIDKFYPRSYTPLSVLESSDGKMLIEFSIDPVESNKGKEVWLLDSRSYAPYRPLDHNGVTLLRAGKDNQTIFAASEDSDSLIIYHYGNFQDVPWKYWARTWTERLYRAGITGGCSTSPIMFCPENPVTRAQMAVFLLRGIHGSAYSPPLVGGSTGFGDVPTDYWAAAWIKQLAAEGITGGCGSGNYCPEAFVTRAQMAVFLLRSKHGSTYSPPSVGGSTGFGDVPTDYWAAAWIKQLVGEAITSGCGGGNYCPEASVTRAQMAVFLVKTFNLP